MIDQEHARYIVSLEARMSRMETMLQQLLGILTTSSTDMQRMLQMQAMLQELQSSQDIRMRGTPDISGAPTSQERPEIRAIREALLSGDKIKAIKLYRSVFGVGLKEAQDAINKM
jgi:ribosomal protein L7/L12